THGRTGVNSCAPVERLIDEGHRCGSTSAENQRADWHTVRVFPCRVDGWALRCRRSKARVGMRSLGSGLSSDLRGPWLALPVSALSGRLIGHAFPPDATFWSESDVGKDRVAGQRRHRVRIGLNGCARCNAEESCFRIDGMKDTVLVWTNPSNVVADGPDLPAIETIRWNQHGEVGLAAGARERRGDIGLLAFWIFDADNQHVLGHPTFIASHGGGDAKCEAFLAKQGVAAVARTVG